VEILSDRQAEGILAAESGGLFPPLSALFRILSPVFQALFAFWANKCKRSFLGTHFFAGIKELVWVTVPKV
jgi:hypothetical protein